MITEINQKLRAILQGPVIVYPFLFAAFPIIFLYAHNISQMSADQIWQPLAAAIVITAVLWVLLSIILRSITKAALATTIFIIFFFSYGHLYALLENCGIVLKHAYLLPSALLTWGYSIFFIYRAKGNYRTTTKLLNIIAIVLIVINLLNISIYYVTKKTLPADGSIQLSETSSNSSASSHTFPDIYFIILDEYAHPDTMKEYYNYDNYEFIDSLKKKGFFIADKSTTHIKETAWSVATILNMERINDDEETVYYKISNSKVAGLLENYHYKLICIGTPFSSNRIKYDLNRYDYHDFYAGQSNSSAITSEFLQILADTTMLRPFYAHFNKDLFQSYFSRGLLDTLSYLKQLPSLKGPKFVYAHLICPHEPFVFDANGGINDPVNWANYRSKQFYRGQYIFISREIENVVDTLLEKSEIPPIIVLMSDHGIRPGHKDIEIGPEEWRKILNSLYLPGIDKSVLYESISPPNVFRFIFNNYFSADYPLLDDFPWSN